MESDDTKFVSLTTEARCAINQHPPSDERLLDWLNGMGIESMPTSEEVRYAAWAMLSHRGYSFDR